MSRDDASLLDIAKAARQIALFLVNVSEADFMSDVKTQSAVLYQLLVIGEAVSGAFGPISQPSHCHSLVSNCWNARPFDPRG